MRAGIVAIVFFAGLLALGHYAAPNFCRGEVALPTLDPRALCGADFHLSRSGSVLLYFGAVAAALFFGVIAALLPGRRKTSPQQALPLTASPAEKTTPEEDKPSEAKPSEDKPSTEAKTPVEAASSPDGKTKPDSAKPDHATVLEQLLASKEAAPAPNPPTPPAPSAETSEVIVEPPAVPPASAPATPDPVVQATAEPAPAVESAAVHAPVTATPVDAPPAAIPASLADATATPAPEAATPVSAPAPVAPPAAVAVEPVVAPPRARQPEAPSLAEAAVAAAILSEATAPKPASQIVPESVSPALFDGTNQELIERFRELRKEDGVNAVAQAQRLLDESTLSALSKGIDPKQHLSDVAHLVLMEDPDLASGVVRGVVVHIAARLKELGVIQKIPTSAL